MTVNELIEQLKTYPGNMRVLTLGYEGGFDDIGLKIEPVLFNVNSKDTWYMGRHGSGMNWEGTIDGSSECVIIGRA